MVAPPIARMQGEECDVDFETPCLLVDERILMENIRRMAESADTLGVRLRPHVKTHKVPELARRQLAAGAVGITVAKVGEAEVMAAAGIEDIFIAYPLVTPSKIARALKLARGRKILFGVDSLEGARMLAGAAVERGLTAEARLEIDTGMHRTGVAETKAEETAAAIARLEGLELTGIFTFRGSMIEGRPTLDRREAGIDEGRRMAALAERLRRRGIGIAEVSVGSTPTAEFAGSVQGVTEVRPGTYIFNDRMQVAYGACPADACALSVLVTVVSAPGPDRIVIDGGSKCFATDAPPGAAPLDLVGFGEVLGHPGLTITRMSEEHGVIELTGGERFSIGDQLRIIPNHVCTTVNLHDSLWLLAEGPEAGSSSNKRPARSVQIAARGRLC